MADAPRKIHLLKQNDCHPLFPTGLWNGFWKWEIVAGRSQFWLPIGNSFSDLLFIAFVIAIIHTVLPQKTLPLCLIVKLKSLCSAHRERIWPCPLVNSYNKKKKLIHCFQRLALSGDVLQECRPFLLYFFTAPPLFCLLTSVPHCLSLSDSITDSKRWLLQKMASRLQKMVTLRHSVQSFSHVWLFATPRTAALQASLTLCGPTDCSTPSFPFLYHLPELTQTHVHRIGDVIQSSRPLLSPSPPAFNLSQHQGLFQLRHESAIFSVSWISE